MYIESLKHVIIVIFCIHVYLIGSGWCFTLQRDFTRYTSVKCFLVNKCTWLIILVTLLIGVYEVGVHIADVSHFIDPKTPLDKMAANRATSVYLVQRVIPMLPRQLCEHLCSLNPHEVGYNNCVLCRFKIVFLAGKTNILCCMATHSKRRGEMITCTYM